MPARRSKVDWSARATELARLIPRSRLHPAALAWADVSPRRARWAVGFSGGPDSLALLLLVWAHWPERRRTLCALHFDHRLRGAESRADAGFCRTVCRALGVKLVTGKWMRPRAAAAPGEAEARAARMAFFQEHARAVWLGHQQDDIAETLLMRIARGSGAGGLSAPRPVHEFPRGRVHVRPLLALKKTEIVAALRTAGIEWREDASNARAVYFRNRIRCDVIPAWVEAAGRDALAGAARSRMLIEEDDRALEAWLEALQPFSDKGQTLSVAALVGKPRALLRRALHRWLLAQPRAGDLSSQAFEALLIAIAAGKPTRHSLGREGFAVIRAGVLRFAPDRKRDCKFHRSAN